MGKKQESSQLLFIPIYCRVLQFPSMARLHGNKMYEPSNLMRNKNMVQMKLKKKL